MPRDDAEQYAKEHPNPHLLRVIYAHDDAMQLRDLARANGRRMLYLFQAAVAQVLAVASLTAAVAVFLLSS